MEANDPIIHPIQETSTSTILPRKVIQLASRIWLVTACCKHPWKKTSLKRLLKNNIVGGCNPSEKYYLNWESSPNRGENEKYLKPPPR